VADVPTSEIVRMMAGRRIDQLFVRSPRDPGEVLLELDGLEGVVLPRRASLVLRRGEVLGIAGLVGAGRTELLRSVFGLDPVRSGKVRLGAFLGPASPARRLAQGMGMLSEDRKGEGLASGLSVTDNLTLSRLPSHHGLVLPGDQKNLSTAWIEKLSIKCGDPSQSVSHLSGGNQQKVALARLLHHDVDVLLLDEPTRGIDVGSKAQIYERVDALALAGKGVLMVSSYLPELLGVCDRVCVMHRGVLGPSHDVAECTEHGLLEEAVGAVA
jgi:ribose transport system ATP-binding protein